MLIHSESGFADVTNSRITGDGVGVYGKVFDSIYDGTLYGHWEAIVTMQQLIVLASPDGVVDMTPQAIAARTSIPLEIIKKGLEVLAAPDPYTRTPGEDGKRIVLMDEHRPWGWRLVNHGKYMRLRNAEQKREADRARIADKRKRISNVATVSQSVANVAHSDTDSDTDSKKQLLASSAKALSAVNGDAVAFIPLNDGKEFGVSKALAAELQKLYPAVDVPQTLNEIRGWNLANPARRKTQRGIVAHLNSWMSREQNRGPKG